VLAGGTSIDTIIERGGTEEVFGIANATTIKGGLLELEIGGAVVGDLTFAGHGGMLKLHAAESFSNNVAGFVRSDTIDLMDFAFATTSITNITGGGGAGSVTNVTLTDSASHLSETLHLVNTTAHEFGTDASNYSLTQDQNTTPIVGTAFHLAAIE
jgi:hypothetical protein